jgi:hypothetical protein
VAFYKKNGIIAPISHHFLRRLALELYHSWK